MRRASRIRIPQLSSFNTILHLTLYCGDDWNIHHGSDVRLQTILIAVVTDVVLFRMVGSSSKLVRDSRWYFLWS